MLSSEIVFEWPTASFRPLSARICRPQDSLAKWRKCGPTDFDLKGCYRVRILSTSRSGIDAKCQFALGAIVLVFQNTSSERTNALASRDRWSFLAPTRVYRPLAVSIGRKKNPGQPVRDLPRDAQRGCIDRCREPATFNLRLSPWYRMLLEPPSPRKQPKTGSQLRARLRRRTFEPRYRRFCAPAGCSDYYDLFTIPEATDRPCRTHS